MKKNALIFGLLLLLAIRQAFAQDMSRVHSANVPKWNRVEMSHGVSGGSFFSSPSARVTTVSYKKVRGNFAVGGKYMASQNEQNKTSDTGVEAEISPDWDLDFKPKVSVGMYLTNATYGAEKGVGSSFSGGLSLEMYKNGPVGVSTRIDFLNQTTGISGYPRNILQSFSVNMAFDMF